jgi:sulfate transport system substrate-binding protein
MQRRTLLAAAAAAILCGASPALADSHLTLVAYSTPREAYQAIIGAFQRTPQGLGVTFDQSYGASGDQSRAVEAGLPADVVAFSLEPDITRLVKDGLVSADWADNSHRGIVTDSVVVLVVRVGNPKNIHGWDDLVKPGVEVITPNPFTSGGARWNVMAAYAAQLTIGRSPAQAEQYLSDLFAHVSVQDKSARESMQTFTGGKGDVMLAYENEAIQAKRTGAAIDYIVPDDDLLIENPVATVTGSSSAQAAQAFVDFLFTDRAQVIFGTYGYRPVMPSAAKV